jgi:hypothetical protein
MAWLFDLVACDGLSCAIEAKDCAHRTARPHHRGNGRSVRLAYDEWLTGVDELTLYRAPFNRHDVEQVVTTPLLHLMQTLTH